MNKGSINSRLKEIAGENDSEEERSTLKNYLALLDREAQLKKELKTAEMALDKRLYDFFPTLTEEQVKELVLEDKWMVALQEKIYGEMERLSQRLAARIKELTQRYAEPLPELDRQVESLEKKVSSHLQAMGFTICGIV